MVSINNILAVSRLSSECATVLRQSFSLAKKYGAKLHILHVNYDPFMHGGLNMPIPNMEKELEDTRAKVRAELNMMVAQEKESGVEFRESVGEGKPVKEILKAVEEDGADLIVMLARSEGRIEHMLFGYTNDEITRKMPCSVLLAKETDEPA